MAFSKSLSMLLARKQQESDRGEPVQNHAEKLFVEITPRLRRLVGFVNPRYIVSKLMRHKATIRLGHATTDLVWEIIPNPACADSDAHFPPLKVTETRHFSTPQSEEEVLWFDSGQELIEYLDAQITDQVKSYTG